MALDTSVCNQIKSSYLKHHGKYRYSRVQNSTEIYFAHDCITK